MMAEKLTEYTDYEFIPEKGAAQEWDEWLMARLDRIDAEYSELGQFFSLTFKDPDVAFGYKMRWL